MLLWHTYKRRNATLAICTIHCKNTVKKFTNRQKQSDIYAGIIVSRMAFHHPNLAHSASNTPALCMRCQAARLPGLRSRSFTVALTSIKERYNLIIAV